MPPEEGGEEDELVKLYKEQAEVVGPDMAKVLSDCLNLRAQTLHKLEYELKEQLVSLKADEIVLEEILKQEFG